MMPQSIQTVPSAVVSLEGGRGLLSKHYKPACMHRMNLGHEYTLNKGNRLLCYLTSHHLDNNKMFRKRGGGH